MNEDDISPELISDDYGMNEADGADAGLDLSEDDILELFEDLKKKSKSDDVFRENGLVVEKLCLGKKMNDVLHQTVFARVGSDPTSSLIILYNLVLTWAALMTKDRPSVYGVPTSNDLMSVAGAEIMTKLIEYIESEEDCQSKWHTSAIHAAQHGTGAIKIIFNKATQRVEWQNLTIYDFWVQNKTRQQDVDWCVIRTYMDQYDAQELLKRVDPDATLPEERDYQDAAGITRTGTEKFEIWYKPSARYPEGLYACIVDNVVVEAMKYPNVFKEPDGAGTKALLPIVWWSARECRDSTLGTSWTRECALIQADINNLYSKIQENARQAKQMLILPASLAQTDMIDDSNARIYVDVANENHAQMIRWVQPAPIDPNVSAALENSINSMYRTSGIAESTTGNAYASQSGKALSYQAQLDSDKHSGAFKGLENAQKAAWELTLKLCQKYYKVPRTFQITGMEPISFMSADIQGVTVRLQARSAREGDASIKTEKAKADMSAGFAGRESLLGSAPSLATAGQAQLANRMIDMFLNGQEFNLTPETIPPEVFVGELNKRIQNSLLKQDFPTVEALNDLLAQYMQMMSGGAGVDAGAGSAQPQSSSPTPIEGGQNVSQANIMDEGAV
jgi:hypothetical protein